MSRKINLSEAALRAEGKREAAWEQLLQHVAFFADIQAQIDGGGFIPDRREFAQAVGRAGARLYNASRIVQGDGLSLGESIAMHEARNAAED